MKKESFLVLSLLRCPHRSAEELRHLRERQVRVSPSTLPLPGALPSERWDRQLFSAVPLSSSL